MGGAAFLACGVRIPLASGSTGTQISNTVSTAYGESEGEGTNSTYTYTTSTHSSGVWTDSEHETSGETGGAGVATFLLLPVNVPSGVPAGYRVGNGSAFLERDDGGLAVSLRLKSMNPSTTYSLSLTLNGTAETVGNFSSTSSGYSEFEASVRVLGGMYLVGMKVSDVSTLASAFQVLGSGGSPQQVVVPTYSGEAVVPSSSSITTHTLAGGDEGEIESAVRNETIPFSVQVTDREVQFSVTDRSFSVFAGPLGADGLQISVSGINGTGPRVLLVNLTSTQAFDLKSGTLLIRFDGTAINQSSSLAGVLNVKSTDAPSFIAVGTAGGYQLLISIPHFSTHIIEIIHAIIQNAAALLSIDWPIAVASMAIITLLFASVYVRRTKLYV